MDKSPEDTSMETNGDTKDVVTGSRTNELPSKYILINRSAALYSSIGAYTKPAPGKVFLLLNMEIENHGYTEFSVNPLYFSIVIDGVEYSYDSATYAIDERGLAPLDSVRIRDGGKTSGCLVFQIPQGKENSRYVIEYSGPGSYVFEYGSLQTQEQKAPEPEPIIRDISFYLGNDLFAISKDNLKGNMGYTSYSTSVRASPSGGETNQETRVEREENGFLVINIKTYLTAESVDKTKAIEDSLKEAEKYIPTYANRIKKAGMHEATLPSGQRVDVHKWEASTSALYRGEANVCSFMPDDSTIVTVVISLPNQLTTKFFETLEIGDIPRS